MSLSDIPDQARVVTITASRQKMTTAIFRLKTELPQRKKGATLR